MAVVVLDVAGAAVRDRGDCLDVFDPLAAFELGEDRFRRAPDVVGEDREAATVGHAEHDFAGTAADGERREFVDHGHDRVEAFDREHLLAEVGLLDEPLELEDVDQPVEQALLLFLGQAACGGRRSRSSRASRPAAGARRCARTGSRSNRCRRRASGAVPRAASRRERRSGGSRPGSSPSVRGSARPFPGRAPGSPFGLAPSGSRWAARWPWVRKALSSEVAAWTAWSSSGVGLALDRAAGGVRLGR